MLVALALVAAALASGTINASAGGPYSVVAGATTTLTASVTSASSNCASPLYAWDTDRDGTYEIAASASPSTTYSADGAIWDGPDTATARVRITNATTAGCNTHDDADATITITNAAPTIASLTRTSPVEPGVAQTMSVAWADVETADTHTVAWSFGDGTTSTAVSPSKSYTADGTYTVTVTVTDDDGGSATSSSTVTVANAPPTFDSTDVPSTATEGDAIEMSVVATDSGGDVVTVSWDFGDSTGETGVDATTHTYADEGYYPVLVTACDSASLCETVELFVDVANADPVVDAFTGDTTGDEGAPFAFACSGSDAGTDDVTTLTLDYGDGTVDALFSHTYADDGVFTVICTIADDDGGSGWEPLPVTVSNVAPIFDAALSAVTGDEGETLAFTTSATDPGDDTVTYLWAFGDGATATGPSASHAYGDDGAYTVTVTASDEDGGATIQSAGATIANTVPVLTLTGDETGDEGETLLYTLTVADLDATTCAWDWGDGESETPATTGAATDATHIYADEGTFALTVECDDGDGGVTSVGLVVDVSNVAPVLTLSGDAAGDEGEALSFTCDATDAGVEDTVDVAWDFGDGTAGSGNVVSHAFGDEGTYVVTCTATDDAGASTFDSLAVAVANVAPTLGPLATDSAGDEGESLAFSGSATDPGTADVVTWSWDWGDGSDSIGESATHAWGDDGTWTVTLTVDDGTDAVVTTLSVVTTNVAPSLGGTPAGSAFAGSIYTFAPVLSDPGALDAWTWSATLPAGAALDAVSGAVTWSPAIADVGTYALELLVTDDDGGAGSLAWTLDVSFLDEDADGLSDLWEIDHGLDPADASDAAADPDADGRTNLDEYAGGTDPGAYDGPSAPTVFSPADGDEVVGTDVELLVTNATGDTLAYSFTISDDVGEVSAVEGVPEDASGRTGWAVDVALTENTWYAWTAAASDAWVTGPAATAEFFYNTTNEAPGAPSIDTPFDGSSVATRTPTLTLGAAVDPDDDALVYGFVLTEADGTPVASVDLVAGLTWEVGPLADGQSYCWQGWATDPDGLVGPSSDVACLEVDLGNLPPSAPVILSPSGGVAVDTVDIVLQDGVDPEGRVVTELFELDTDPAFTSPARQAAEIVSDGSGTTIWTVGPLDDATGYYVRALSFDGAAFSEWATGSFEVNLDDLPPETPELVSPVDGETVPLMAALVVANAVDPDGDAVIYEFVVRNANGMIVGSGTVDEGPDGETAWTPPGLADGGYAWSARAIDVWGAASDWAEPRDFVVQAEEAEEAVVAREGGWLGGGGCSTTGAGFPGVIVLILSALVSRRR